jgi:hypothetical protein
MRRWIVWMLFFSCLGAAFARAEDVLLTLRGTPSDGLVVSSIDLTAAARWCGRTPVRPETIGAIALDGRRVPFQFVPDADYHPVDNVAGTAVMQLSTSGPIQVRLVFDATPIETEPWDGIARTSSAVFHHDAARMAGLPWRIEFSGTGKVFDDFRWHDRVYHAETGGLRFADDSRAQVQRLAAGPLCTVVQVTGRYTRPDGAPAAEPEAIYQWFYFHDRPLVHVTVWQRQRQTYTWKEAHFLELNFPGEDFLEFAGGQPPIAGKFEATGTGTSFDQWAALSDGTNAIGAVRSGPLLIYDGRGGYGTYLHAHRDIAWSPWDGSPRRLAAWLWIGSADDPARVIRETAEKLPLAAGVAVQVDTIRQKIEAAAQSIEALSPEERQPLWWRVLGAKQLEALGRLEAAAHTADGQKPKGWTTITAGQLGAILERTQGGLRLLGIFDTVAPKQLTAAETLPLFELTMRHAETREDVPLRADTGWKRIDVDQAGGAVEIRWTGPDDQRLGALAVVARAVAHSAASSLHWTLRVDAPSDSWSVWRTVFPQIAVAELADDARVLVPRAAGEVQEGVWQRNFRFAGTYPGGWTSMQFLAAYAPQANTGLYVATHDPRGSTKDISAQSNPAERSFVFRFSHPALDMGVAGNGFELSGHAVWQLLRGDWFDASMIYRDWVRREARWFPKLGRDGREDTPLWMRELPAWALGGGEAQDCVPAVKQFAESLAVPVGFHWYNWHQIPFDNDYPHYFPTREGFRQGVAELQDAGVYVMPYINGRLWDTRDRGVEDFQFSSVALPAATKDEQGEPYLESYSSKEADGSIVKLAAMCPATELWRNKVTEIVLRLMNEYGVKGVYIDQVAAAVPVLCFDASHGHPLGGGHWWVDAYQAMLDAIRRQMPENYMLTTECNAEPYLHCFDGYLTWHWQYDGQVPAFPAVYGGAVQMFGRAYRGGPTKDLALRMKAGEQLVFGEQIGWIHPGVVHERENADFFRQIVRLRWELRRYFYAGEMARPPRLIGDLPRVTADWQWQGVWPVTTDAVRVGAWRLAAEKRIVILAVNVGDDPVTATLTFDAGEYGFDQPEVRATEILPQRRGETFTTPPAVNRQVTFAPRKALAWELAEP